MPERPPSGKRHPTASEDALLLQEIESLNRALSADPKHHRIRPADSKPQTASSSSSRKEKKPSFWNWKPLKALSHIGQRRFDCIFSFHVHSIENIPDALADASLSVQWRRTTDPPSASAGTTSVKVFDGVAEFEETLTYRCSVYGARPSSNHSATKYEARRFLIYASVCDSPGMDLGKHLVDLTRLLPLTLEELDDAGSSSGKWSTSFRLIGEGIGASLSVSFGFSLIREGALGSSSENRVLDVLNLKMVEEGSVGRGRGKGRRWGRSQSVEDVKVLHELLPTSKSHASSLADSVENMELTIGQEVEPCDSEASLKTDVQIEDEFSETKPSTLLEHVEGSYQNNLEQPEFNVIEQGVEIAANDQLCAPIFDRIDLEQDDQLKVASKVDEEITGFSTCSKECASLHDGNPLTRECQGMTTHSLLFSEPEDVEMLHSETMTSNQTSQIEVKSEHKQGDLENDHFSFDTSEAIAAEFLNMLSVEHIPVVLSSDSDPESPRERLWKQFEKETLGAGSIFFGLDIETELDDGTRKKDYVSEDPEDFDLSPMVPEVEREILDTTHVLSHGSTAELLEVAETEALMKKWGLNENTFQCSLPGSRSSFATSTDLSMEVPLKLPPLGEGLGSFFRTKDGGFLRSMSPSLFKNAKNNASLIMQVSSPVVVPAELGSSIMEILQRLASVGIEKLSIQAKKLMPIEDVAGKTMQQIAFEASSPLDDCKRLDILLPLNGHASASISEKVSGRRNKPEALDFSSCSAYEIDSGYVSIDDLAPLAMDKIEALSMEGLKIQSGMSIEEAPSNICSHCFGNISVLEENGSNNGRLTTLEGTEGLHLIDFKDKEDDIDELLSLSITLDEWVRLDSGMVDDEVQISDRTSKILAAHSSSLPDLITGGWKQEAMCGKSSGRRWGLLGSNFTAALMVQLRDPLRNYDPVGTPMLGLIQVERVFMPPKIKVCTNISVKGNNDEDDEPESELKSQPVVNGKKEEEDGIPRFKITGVHVAGLKTEPNKKKSWGKPMQQQSGSRWLLASGMGKGNKHPFMKSKFVSEPSLGNAAVSPGDVLWSISSFVCGTGSRLKEQLVNSHIRNPNLLFPKPTVSLHSAD